MSARLTGAWRVLYIAVALPLDILSLPFDVLALVCQWTSDRLYMLRHRWKVTVEVLSGVTAARRREQEEARRTYLEQLRPVLREINRR